MNEVTLLQLLFQAISTLGVTGVLCFMLWAFWTGSIVPTRVLDRIIILYEKKLDELISRLLARIVENERMYEERLEKETNRIVIRLGKRQNVSKR